MTYIGFALFMAIGFSAGCISGCLLMGIPVKRLLEKNFWKMK